MDILNIDPRVLLIQGLGFFLLLIVFKLFLWKPLMDILEARRAEVANEYGSAEAERKAAEEFRAEYEKRLADIESEMRAKVAEAVKEGHAMREEIINDSRAQADRILAKAEEEIGREKEKAMAELRATVANLAIGAAGRLINEKLDPAKHHQLVDKFIDEVGSAAK